MKKILIILTFLPIIFMSGCAVEYENNIYTAAIEHMENTYGEPFSYLKSIADGKLLLDSYTLPNHVYVEGTFNEETGEYEFVDNYMAVKYEEDLKELFDITVGCFFEEYIFEAYVEQVPAPSDLNINSSFVDYLSHPDSEYSGIIVVPEGDFTKETFNYLLEATKLMKFHPNITVFVVEKDSFNNCTIDIAAKKHLYSLSNN